MADNNEMMHHIPFYNVQTTGDTGDNPDISCLSESIISVGDEVLVKRDVLLPGDSQKKKYSNLFNFKIVDITDKLQTTQKNNIDHGLNSSLNESCEETLNTSQQASK